MRFRILALVLLLATGGCARGSQAASCDEFAAEVDALLARDAPAAEIEAFIQDSDERVARLISGDPDNAEPWVTAVLEAMFTAEFAELGELLGE